MEEAFFVMLNRDDGDLPLLAKACGDRFYLLREDAEAELKELTETIGSYFGVYRGTVVLRERVR